MKPFYPDPRAADYTTERSKQFKVFIGKIDPFTAVNI